MVGCCRAGKHIEGGRGFDDFSFCFCLPFPLESSPLLEVLDDF
jgi:hypothetical protein